MTMKECYRKIEYRYPNTAISAEFALSTFRPRCTIYVASVGHFEGQTWDEAMYKLEYKDAVQEVPEEEYDCPIHGKLGGIDECPKC